MPHFQWARLPASTKCIWRESGSHREREVWPGKAAMPCGRQGLYTEQHAADCACLFREHTRAGVQSWAWYTSLPALKNSRGSKKTEGKHAWLPTVKQAWGQLYWSWLKGLRPCSSSVVFCFPPRWKGVHSSYRKWAICIWTSLKALKNDSILSQWIIRNCWGRRPWTI